MHLGDHKYYNNTLNSHYKRVVTDSAPRTRTKQQNIHLTYTAGVPGTLVESNILAWGLIVFEGSDQRGNKGSLNIMMRSLPLSIRSACPSRYYGFFVVRRIKSNYVSMSHSHIYTPAHRVILLVARVCIYI